MELRIGENIKWMQKNKGMTQEQLAELLNVSCAAVSKWESGDTYPDITMIFPLAHLFEVSVDELMGYDAACIEAEIKKAISDYRQLNEKGEFREAAEIIKNARRKYPNDYRIMSMYMWDIVGGSADNNPEVLNAHRDELMELCDCILSGCTDEKLRLEAMTMKAKLFHSAKNTSAALEILAQFPSWYQSSGQKTEQLFAKDTPEFRYWVRRNLYELADFSADKVSKVIFFDTERKLEDKVPEIEAVGDCLMEDYDKCGNTFFCVMGNSLYGRLANDLVYRGGSDADIIRIRGKRLAAAKSITAAALDDTALSDFINEGRNADNYLKWLVNYFKTTAEPHLARLHENPEYMAMLERYNK